MLFHVFYSIALLIILVSDAFGIEVVNTSYGKLRGITFHNNGKRNHIFKAVPFAKPPIGNLRFRLPEPPERWYGVRDATTYSAACMSNPIGSSSVQKEYSEDCLYLNVFTTDKCLKSSCKVLVYFHGGAFSKESAVMFPDNFIIDRYASQDIVFVIPAMRLGAFGVITFGNENIVPQNLAAYDAIAALEYVHEEIANFGGDPKSVTIMGHSSGASLSMALSISSVIDPSQELFQKTILLSATNAYAEPSLLISNSFKLAETSGCLNGTIVTSEVIACLQTLDSIELMGLQNSLEKDDRFFKVLLFGPPFTDFNDTKANFISTALPRKLIMGNTQTEFGGEDYIGNPNLAGGFMDFENPFEVDQKYFADKDRGLIDFNVESQSVFVSAIQYSDGIVANGGEVFLFETKQKPISNHITDMQYFIGTHNAPFKTEDMIILDSFYSKMLVNFTKFDVPSPEWEPYNSTRRNFYALEVDKKKNIFPKNEENYHEAEYNYWTQNMTAFDREVSGQKASSIPVVLPTRAIKTSTPTTPSNKEQADHSTTQNLQPNFTTTNTYPYYQTTQTTFVITSQWWFYILILLVVIAVVALVTYVYKICFKTEESTPLLS